MLSATIARSVRIEGRGIFSGEPCAVLLNPASPGSGITFIKNGVPIPAYPDNYIEGPETANTTGFQAGGQRVLMTEHLMAALWCVGIDTVDVYCYGVELPNYDGSAMLYCEALRQVPLLKYDERLLLPLHEAVCITQTSAGIAVASSIPAKRSKDSPALLAVTPAESLSIEYHFSHPELGYAEYWSQLSRETAATELMPARTFITQAEAEQLQAAGVLKHNDETSALVVRGGQPVRTLRYDNEYARHKVLDLLGDLYCLPYELTGEIIAIRSGHALNRALARKLLEIGG